MVAVSRLVPVQVGDFEVLVETVPVAGTEATGSGRAVRALENAQEAFARAQDTIVEIARSTGQMIGRTAGAARPDRVEVEFGLKFSASGTVILAGAAGEASLKVTLSYEASRRPAGEPAAAVPVAGGEGLPGGGSSVGLLDGPS